MIKRARNAALTVAAVVAAPAAFAQDNTPLMDAFDAELPVVSDTVTHVGGQLIGVVILIALTYLVYKMARRGIGR